MNEEIKNISEEIKSIVNELVNTTAKFDKLIDERYNEIVEEGGDAYIDEQYNSLNNQKQSEVDELKVKLEKLVNKKVALEKEIEADQEERKQLEADKEKRLEELSNKINSRIDMLQDSGEDIYLDEELTSMQLEYGKIKEEKIITQREKAEIEKAKEVEEKRRIQKEKEAKELEEAKHNYIDLKNDKVQYEEELARLEKAKAENGTYQRLKQEKEMLDEELKKLKKDSVEYKECSTDIEKISKELMGHDAEILFKKEQIEKAKLNIEELENKYGKEVFLIHPVKIARKDKQVPAPVPAPVQSGTSQDAKKFTYKVSADGIYYNSELITPDELKERMDVLYSGKYDEKYSVIVNELLEKGNDEHLIGLILSDNKLDQKQRYERLVAYKESLLDAEEKDKAGKENVQTEYDLRNTSFISRIMGKCKYSAEFIKILKETAYKNRNNVNTKVEVGPLTKLQFKIREAIERSSTLKIEAQNSNRAVEKSTATSQNNEENKSWELTPEQKAKANRVSSMAKTIKEKIVGKTSSNKDGIEH